MKIYDGPLGRVDLVGVELYIGDLIVVSRPTSAQTRLSLGYIDKYNTDSGFITIRLKDFKPKYQWERELISMFFEPGKFYKVARRGLTNYDNCRKV